MKTKPTITLLETKAGHYYKIEGEEYQEDLYLPSSTTILTAFPNKGLDIWRENSYPEDIRRAQESGKIQGTKVHKCIELQILGQKVLTSGITDEQIRMLGLVDRKLVAYLKDPLTEREEEALIGFENWCEVYKPIFVASEMMVFSKKHLYAGTLDALCYLWDKKAEKYELYIVDWKISKVLDASYELQIASYKQAIKETYHKSFKGLKLGILQLGKNKCNYSFKVVKEPKEAMKLFLITKKLWDGANPNAKPTIVQRRESFEMEKFVKKGKLISLK